MMQARRASRDARECRATMEALRKIGFFDDGGVAFSRLHHQHGSAMTFYKFSKGVQQYRDDRNNHRVHQRLMFVLLSCPGGALPKGESFQMLAEEAFRLIPPIA